MTFSGCLFFNAFSLWIWKYSKDVGMNAVIALGHDALFRGDTFALVSLVV